MTPLMRKLRAHYEREKVLAAGTFGLEVYPCKASEFWLNPAYGNDAFVKIDVIWFESERNDPSASYYPQFWDLLSEFDFRLHWGKYLPAASRPWQDYIRRQYPKWDEWLTIRDEMDPQRVFVSDYWRDHLGI